MGMALLEFNMQPLNWERFPPEFAGPNGSSARGSMQPVFLQLPNLDETFSMNNRLLFTIHNPQNTFIK